MLSDSVAFEFGRDLRVAARRLRRSPAFAATAVFVLGLGIGVGTAFFNILNGGWFTQTRDVPGAVRFAASTCGPESSCLLRPEDLAMVAANPPGSLSWVVGNSSQRRTSVRIAGTSMVVNADSVSGPYFSALGTVPVTGRLLGPADDQVDLTPAAVISEQLWRTTLNSDPAIVGSAAYVAGQPVVIVGVVARSFEGLGSILPPDVWVTSRVVSVRQLYGRLRDGVTFEQAAAEIRARYPAPTDSEPRRTLEMRRGLTPPLPTRFAILITGFLAVNGLVVLVAAASLTLLLLARVLAARSDIGVRLMLGASVWEIARLWIAEVALIGGAAGLVGLGIAAWLARTTLEYVMSVSALGASHLNTAPDWRVAGYVLLMTLAVMAGIVVVLTRQLATLNALTAASATEGTGGVTPRDAGRRGRFIAAQVAIATCLLLLAAFFLRRTSNDLDVDPGFDMTHVVVARIDQAGADESLVQRNNHRALEAATITPGVAAVALTTLGGLSTRASVLDSSFSGGVVYQGITSQFFETLQLPLRRGRSISIADERGASPVAVIGERTAEAFWPGRDPVGQEILLGGRDGSRHPVHVIGVVPDVRYGASGAGSHPTLMVYLPYDYVIDAWGPDTATVIARGSGPASAIVTSLRDSIGRTDPQIGFLSIRTLKDELTHETGSAQVSTRILATLGFFGLVLAVTGLFGLTAYLANQRHREFGIRKALGATNLVLSRMVTVEGLPPLARGAGIGAFAAILIGFWLRARQFHTLHPFDPVSLVGVTIVLVLAGLIGTVLPFARLIRRDASTMLREL